MRACPQCQRTYPDDTELCPRDGAPLRRGNPRGCPRTATRAAPCGGGLRPPDSCGMAILAMT
jgi:predicted amidophosphoribosyltransferase